MRARQSSGRKRSSEHGWLFPPFTACFVRSSRVYPERSQQRPYVRPQKSASFPSTSLAAPPSQVFRSSRWTADGQSGLHVSNGQVGQRSSAGLVMRGSAAISSDFGGSSDDRPGTQRNLATQASLCLPTKNLRTLQLFAVAKFEKGAREKLQREKRTQLNHPHPRS